MKNTFKAAALVGLALAAVSSAQAQYNQGDLLVGFTGNNGKTAANTYDLVVDLGSASSLTAGQTWDLSALLTGNTGNLSTLANDSWGVLGLTSGSYNAGSSTVYATFVGSSSTLNPLDKPTFNNAKADVGTIGIANVPSGSSGYVLASDSASWSSQTLGSANWANDFFNPNVTGVGSVNFYAEQASGVTQDAYFSLNSNGVLGFATVAPVPEPGSYYLLSSGGLLLLALRRRLSFKA